MRKLRNHEVRAAVLDLVNFQNTNGTLFGRWETPTLYVVYSYGEHWPLFLRDSRVSWSWAENDSRYGVTTSKHRSLAHPHEKTVGSNTVEMREYIRKAKAEV